MSTRSHSIQMHESEITMVVLEGGIMALAEELDPVIKTDGV